MTNRIIIHSHEHRSETRDQFLLAFDLDPRPFAKKLKDIGISKGGFSSLKNGTYLPQKKMMAKIVAYMGGTTFRFNKDTHFFCSGCASTRGLDLRSSDPWFCRKCKTIIRFNSRMRVPGVFWARKRNRRLVKKYGSFASTMRLVIAIKKELKKYETEQTPNGRGPTGIPMGRARKTAKKANQSTRGKCDNDGLRKVLTKGDIKLLDKE